MKSAIVEFVKSPVMEFAKPAVVEPVKFAKGGVESVTVESGKSGVESATVECWKAAMESTTMEWWKPAMESSTVEPAAACEIRPQESGSEKQSSQHASQSFAYPSLDHTSGFLIHHRLPD